MTDKINVTFLQLNKCSKKSNLDFLTDNHIRLVSILTLYSCHEPIYAECDRNVGDRVAKGMLGESASGLFPTVLSEQGLIFLQPIISYSVYGLSLGYYKFFLRFNTCKSTIVDKFIVCNDESPRLC